MNIQTVKIQQNGFLVNDIIQVPSAQGNRHYQEVQAWILDGNTPEAEFTAGQLLAIAKSTKIVELNEDYLVAAEADVLVQGSMYPADKDYQLIILTLASRSSRGRSNPTTIRGADGMPVNLTPALLGSLEDAIFNQIATSLETLSIKLGLVTVAISVQEVEAITFVG